MDEDPLDRINAQDALDHPFFKDHALMPTTKDMVILPSHILQLFNVFKNEKYDDPKELEGKNIHSSYGEGENWAKTCDLGLYFHDFVDTKLLQCVLVRIQRCTLQSLIDAHCALIVFGKKSTLCMLIRYCAIIVLCIY